VYPKFRAQRGIWAEHEEYIVRSRDTRLLFDPARGKRTE